jgi:hypothetical protein
MGRGAHIGKCGTSRGVSVGYSWAWAIALCFPDGVGALGGNIVIVHGDYYLPRRLLVECYERDTTLYENLQTVTSLFKGGGGGGGYEAKHIL